MIRNLIEILPGTPPMPENMRNWAEQGWASEKQKSPWMNYDPETLFLHHRNEVLFN
jgi:hypothetical protein